MTAGVEDGIALVLASQRSFERLVGPVPAHLAERLVFRKPIWPEEIEPLLTRARAVVSKGYGNAWLERIVLEARRRSIRTLFVVDGPLEWSNSYTNPHLRRRLGDTPAALMEPLVYDAVATTSTAQTRYLAFKNRNRNIEFTSYASHRIDSTGLTRGGHRSNGATSSPSHAGAAATDDHDRTPKDAGHQWDFLVTTAKTPYFNERERRDLTRVLERVCDALRSSERRFAVRLFDDRLIEAAGDAHNDRDGNFADALSRTRCVIGTPSSVLLESMLHAKPTATLLYRDGPLFHQTGWLIGCTEDLEPTFESMLTAERTRMEFQASELGKHVDSRDFYEWFEDWLKRDPPQEAALDPASLEFENGVLRKLIGGALWLAKPALPLAHWLADRRSP